MRTIRKGDVVKDSIGWKYAIEDGKVADKSLDGPQPKGFGGLRSLPEKCWSMSYAT